MCFDRLFQDMCWLQAVSKILAVLGGPRVREALSHTFLRVFCEYTNAISANFLRFRDDEGALPNTLGTRLSSSVKLIQDTSRLAAASPSLLP